MRTLRVTVPGSTANLGPGFDALGMALALHDVVEIEITDDGLTVEVVDAGAGAVTDVPLDETHLVVRAFRRACASLELRPPGLRLRCYNTIPHARGVGSSAAAVVAGIAGAYALAGAELDVTALRLAAEFEGHADNAAASLFGGLVLTWQDTAGFDAVRLDPHPAIRPVLAVAQQRASTDAARGALPDRVPHADAAFNAGRAALAVHALTARPDLLFPATADRLHQDYRAEALRASGELVRALRAVGVPAAISGAGPSVLALTTTGSLPADVNTRGFAVTELPVATDGVRVSPGAA